MAKKTVVGNLQVRLTAFTKPLEKGLTRSRKKLRGFGRDANSITKRFSGGFVAMSAAVNTLMAPLKVLGRLMSSVLKVIVKFTKLVAFGLVGATAAATAGLILLTRNAFKDIDQISKESDKLGFLTETLVNLRTAAVIAGIENKQLGKGMQKMIKNVAEAATGIGEAVREIERLGLSAKELNRLAPEKQLLKILDALQRIPLQSDRVLIGEKIFGGRGLDLIRLTSAGLKEAARDADRFALTFSRIDGAKVEAANDAFARLKLLLTGVGRVIAFEIAPVIELALTKLVDFATRGGSLGDTVRDLMGRAFVFAGKGIDALAQGFVDILPTVASVASNILTIFGRMAEQLGAIGIRVSKVWAGVFDFIALEGIFGMTEEFDVAIATIQGTLKAAFAGIRASNPALALLFGTPDFSKQPFPEVQEGRAKRLAERGRKSEEFFEGIRDFGTKTIDFGDLVEVNINKFAARLQDFLDEGLLSERFKGFIDKARGLSGGSEVDRFGTAIDDFVEGAETFQKAVDAGTGKQGKRALVALNDATTDTSKFGMDTGTKMSDEGTHSKLEAIRSLLAQQAVLA